MSGFLLRERDVRALLDAVDRLYQPLEAANFPAHLFAILAELLPGTAVSLDFVDPARHRAESRVGPNGVSPALAVEIGMVVQEFVWQNPVASHLTSTQRTAVIQPTDLISQRQFRGTDLYQLAFRPSGMEYQIVAGLAWPNGFGGMVINRSGPRNFTPREVELVACLRPHVERAYLHLWRFEDLTRRLAQAQACAAAVSDVGCPAGTTVGNLTRRELEVSRWIGQGKRNGEIALILGISLRTVEKHVEHLLAKLGVETRTAVAMVARELPRSHDGPLPL